MSRKRIKPASPLNRDLGVNRNEDAAIGAVLLKNAVGPRGELIFKTVCLLAVLEKSDRDLHPGELALLAAFARLDAVETPAREHRPAIAAWVRKCLTAMAPASQPQQPKRGRGRPTDQRLATMVSQARLDIEYFDTLRALGLGRVPSDRDVLGKAVTRTPLPPEMPDWSARPRATFKQRVDALKKAVDRDRRRG